jgi:hypothetical protein
LVFIAGFPAPPPPPHGYTLLFPPLSHSPFTASPRAATHRHIFPSLQLWVSLLLLGRLKWHGKILAKRRERNSSHPNHRKILKNEFLKIVLKYKIILQERRSFIRKVFNSVRILI